jgi:high-affinity iron transporter
MIASFLIALREGLEAALIVGIALGVLVKLRRGDLRRWVWSGVAAAVLISLGVAWALNAMGASLEGPAEEVFEGIAMLLAAGVLTWMIFWMQRQGSRIQRELERDVRSAASQGQAWGLFGIAFFAVLREGIETALFLTAAAMASGSQQTLAGGLLGLAAAVAVGWLIFATTVRLNVRRFFQVTSVLLILFAAGLVAHGIHEFNEVGWVPPIIEHVWDINPILDENSTVGTLLKALFGYNGNPSLTEVIAYVLYYAVVLLGLRRLPGKREQLAQPAQT